MDRCLPRLLPRFQPRARHNPASSPVPQPASRRRPVRRTSSASRAKAGCAYRCPAEPPAVQLASHSGCACSVMSHCLHTIVVRAQLGPRPCVRRSRAAREAERYRRSGSLARVARGFNSVLRGFNSVKNHRSAPICRLITLMWSGAQGHYDLGYAAPIRLLAEKAAGRA